MGLENAVYVASERLVAEASTTEKPEKHVPHSPPEPEL